MEEKNKYTVFYSSQFSIEFERYPVYQQDKVLEFALVFVERGLDDFSLYEGKISPSWKVDSSDPKYLEKTIYARQHGLWHYHVGLPNYKQVPGVPYKTSDWVLHFQWYEGDSHITLVDLYKHYTHDGFFYLPPETYLIPESEPEE